MTKDQVESLLIKYDKYANLDIGEKLILELERVPEKFIQTPLLVSLLYRTYAVNNSIGERICTFYDEVYQALYKGHDLINKGGFIRKKDSQLDYENFRHLIRALCYYMSISKKSSFSNRTELHQFIEKSTQLASIKPSTTSNFITDLLVSVPLMIKEGNEYKFIHKTIIEFFAAEFIVLHVDSKNKLQQIFKSKSFQYFNKVIDFIYDINPSLYNKVITKYFAENASKVIFNDDELNVNLLKTLNFLSECYIGIWENNYNEKDDESREQNTTVRRTEKLPTDFQSNIHSIITTPFGTAEQKTYELSIVQRIKNHNMHIAALENICNQVKLNTIKSSIDSPIDELLNVIKPNQWHLVTQDFEVHLLRFNRVLNLVGSLLSHDRFSNKSNNIISVLSKNKISNMLEMINIEDQIDKELEGLLN